MSLEWKDIANVVGKTAPILGTVLGGPAGGAIGSLVSSALGVENKPSEVIKAIETNPQIAVKLKELEIQEESMLKDHIKQMAQIDLDYQKEYVKDKDSARTREIELSKNGDNLTQNILAIIGTVAFFGLAFYIVTNGLNEMNKEESFIVGMVVGSVMMIGKEIYGYYFGSSSGSKEKTQHLKAK